MHATELLDRTICPGVSMPARCLLGVWLEEAPAGTSLRTESSLTRSVMVAYPSRMPIEEARRGDIGLVR